MLESIYAEAFVDSILRNDTTLNGPTALNGPATLSERYIYKNRAPQNPTLPLVIYNVQTPEDFMLLNKERLFSQHLFQVRTVGKVIGTTLENPTKFRVAAHRVDELLKRKRRVSFTVEGVTKFYNVWRESELAVREEPGETADVFYRNYGGLYMVQVF